MSSFIKNTKEVNQIVIIETDGYLNKEGGEAIAAICYEKIKAGQVNFLINMATTKVVNSIGVSILIEIIEKLPTSKDPQTFIALCERVDHLGQHNYSKKRIITTQTVRSELEI
jgi:anti-anti-sigma regulatory factor